MLSLFSSFDYTLLTFPVYVEMFTFFSFLCFSKKFAAFMKVYKILNLMVYNFFHSISSFGYSKSVSFLFWCVMIFVALLNFASVFPFNFAHSSQLSSVLFLSLGVWMGLSIFHFMVNLRGFLGHCIPEGSPKILVPALFLIEVVSNLIRPITLTIRLVANILAGHLLLILLAKVVFSFFPSSIFFVLLNLVELFVALIQAYIFVTMMTLYYCDVN